MRILLINAEVSERIKRCRSFAENNRIPRAHMEQLVAEHKAVGDLDEGYVCRVPDGFLVVYSIEEHPPGWCRHLSVSVASTDKLPNPAAVDALLEEFGFRGGVLKGGVKVWIEGKTAINVVELADVQEALAEQ